MTNDNRYHTPQAARENRSKPGRFTIRPIRLFLWMAAVPLWVFVIFALGGGTGWGEQPIGFVAVCTVLLMLTVVIQRVVGSCLLAIIAAPLVAFMAIYLVSRMVSGG